MEYLGFGALIVAVVLLFLVYQKLNNKEKSSEYDQISLGDIINQKEERRIIYALCSMGL